MKVLTIYDGSGPKYHRLLLPLSLMGGIELTINSVLLDIQAEDCDILFINRAISGISLDKICQLRDKYGFKLVVDFDDHWQLSPDHYLYRHYLENKASEVMELYIREADAVTVTHSRLADEVYQLNSNVHILPNALPRFGQFLAHREPSPFTRLFWAGGVTHAKDIELLRNPIKRIATLPNIQMVMVGYNSKNEAYRSMASAFTMGGKINNNLIESLPVTQYYYSYSQCDIALIPLTDTVFNSHKSNLKLLEAANASSPVVVSRVHPYLDMPEDLVNYVSNQSDWYKQVKRLVMDKELQQYQGMHLHNYCRQHFNFEKINKERKNLFDVITGKQTEVAELQEADRTVA